MSELFSIKIIKKLPFSGSEDSIQSRLKKVSLRGFPHVKIYEHATFEPVFLTPAEIEGNLYTSQPYVYQNDLDRLERLSLLFKEKGVDIFNLDRGYDFIGRTQSDETLWTMIPPIVERLYIPQDEFGRFNYEPLFSNELKETLIRERLGIDEGVFFLSYSSLNGIFDLINDGMHRIHYGYLTGGVRILRIEGMTFGYPYYAAPQSYSSVRVISEKDEETTGMKVHVLRSPGHKLLYRLFPTGDIHSGDVRPARIGETFI